MKKIEALKNNKTGELKYPPIKEDASTTGRYSKGIYLLYGIHPKSEYSKATCLLIEESELEAKIGEIQKELSWMVTMPNANEFDEGYIQASEDISKLLTNLLNSLTK